MINCNWTRTNMIEEIWYTSGQRTKKQKNPMPLLYKLISIPFTCSSGFKKVYPFLNWRGIVSSSTSNTLQKKICES